MTQMTQKSTYLLPPETGGWFAISGFAPHIAERLKNVAIDFLCD